MMIFSVTVAYNHNTQKALSSQSLKEEYLAANTGYSSSSIDGNKAERLIHPIVIQAAYRYQIDPALVKAIIMAESGYNARAISKRGAKGLMQLMPATAQELGVEDVFNPRQNISGGVRYFKQLVNQFDGDVKLALAAYNAGPARVRRLRAEAAEQGLDPNVWYRNVEVVAAKRVGSETVRYVSNITKYWIAYRMVTDQRERTGEDG